MKNKILNKDLIKLIKDHLDQTNSKQKPKIETYSLQELQKCCKIYNLPIDKI